MSIMTDMTKIRKSTHTNC